MAYTDYDYDAVLEGATALSKEYGMSMADTIQHIVEEKIPTAIEEITLDMLACSDRDELQVMIDEMVRFKIFEIHYTKFALDYLVPNK